MKEAYLQLLNSNPICTKCKTNPHTTSSQWCQPCINERAKIRRKLNGGAWWSKLTPEQHAKRKARQQIYDCVKDGRMKRMPCEVCGNPNSEGHHYMGYDRKFFKVVRWLCKLHHVEEEKNQLTVGGIVV